MKKQIFIVYLTTNLVTSKQYIGDHSTYDLNCYYTKKYFGSGIAINNAIKKYGKKNFKKEILDDSFKTKQEAFDAQAKYIIEYNTLVPNGYNISPKGGMCINGGCSLETKEKMSKAKKGLKFSDDHKRKISEAQTGKKQSQETINKRIEKIKGTKYIRTKQSKYTRHHSDETRQKISNALRNKKRAKRPYVKRLPFIDQLINKYGEIEGNKKFKEHNQKSIPKKYIKYS